MTAVDNTTDAKVPQTCNEKLCLAVFGIMQEVRACTSFTWHTLQDGCCRGLDVRHAGVGGFAVRATL